MPSSLHEAIAELFRNRPALAAEVLERFLHLERAEPILAIVVEVQLKEDRRKRKTWPDYLTGLHSRYDCPAILLVVCPARGTAVWAAEPIAIGHPGFILRPLVLGPDLMPVITDVAEAVAVPNWRSCRGLPTARTRPSGTRRSPQWRRRSRPRTPTWPLCMLMS
jgi:hypothetical protein